MFIQELMPQVLQIHGHLFLERNRKILRALVFQEILA
jgi:hypothetical protein